MKIFIHIFLFFAVILFTSSSNFSQDMNTAQIILQTGDETPSFQTNDDQGNLWIFPDFFKQDYLVIYFYPAAMTGGWTKQACSYRDRSDILKKLGIEIVGISGDAVINLKYFKQANNLNFPLLSDVSGNIAQKFGVPTKQGGSIKKIIAGRNITLNRAKTTSRWTFIVNKNGKIIYKNTNVKAANDSNEVIEFIKNLINPIN